MGWGMKKILLGSLLLLLASCAPSRAYYMYSGGHELIVVKHGGQTTIYHSLWCRTNDLNSK